jgi:hypothetical protein
VLRNRQQKHTANTFLLLREREILQSGNDCSGDAATCQGEIKRDEIPRFYGLVFRFRHSKAGTVERVIRDA